MLCDNQFRRTDDFYGSDYRSTELIITASRAWLEEISSRDKAFVFDLSTFMF